MSQGQIIQPARGLGRSGVALAGAPMSFTAQVTGLTPGLTKVFDAAALQPGYRTPYWIDCITMVIKSPSIASQSNAVGCSNGTGFGSVIDFQFQTGHHAFSAKPIAAPCFTQRYMSRFDGIFNLTTGSPEELGQRTTVTANSPSPGVTTTLRNFYCVYRWLLPKPLLLLPGDVVIASATRNSQIAAGSTASPTGQTFSAAMTATVTYTGRACEPGAKLPKFQCVPWVGMFDQIDVGSGAAITPWANTYREFENPFQHVWNVQKLVARAVLATNNNSTSSGQVTNLSTSTGGMNSWSVKITDPLAYQITNGFVSIENLANLDGPSSWTFSRPVGPRQRVNMEFDFGTSTLASTLSTRKMVSLVGYREEPL